MKMPICSFQQPKNYFLSDSFKTSSVYYTHHNTFSNYFIMSSFLDLKKTVHVTEVRGIISDFLS